MWKIFAAFVVFAGLALFVIMKGGDKIDMQGESDAGGHATESASANVSAQAPAPVASAPAVAPAAASK